MDSEEIKAHHRTFTTHRSGGRIWAPRLVQKAIKGLSAKSLAGLWFRVTFWHSLCWSDGQLWGKHKHCACSQFAAVAQGGSRLTFGRRAATLLYWNRYWQSKSFNNIHSQNDRQTESCSCLDWSVMITFPFTRRFHLKCDPAMLYNAVDILNTTFIM